MIKLFFREPKLDGGIMKLVKKCVKLIRGFLNAMQEDCVGAYAAQTAYFIMLSFFPFIILLVTLVPVSYTHLDVYKRQTEE